MKTLKDVSLGVTAPISFNRPGALPGAPRVVNTEEFYLEVEHGVLADLGERPHSLL